MPVERDRRADHGPQPADADRLGAQSDRHLDRPDRRLTGLQQDLSSATDEPRDQIVRTVSLTDLVEPLLDGDVLRRRGPVVMSAHHSTACAGPRSTSTANSSNTDGSMPRSSASKRAGRVMDHQMAYGPREAQSTPGSARRRARETRCRHAHTRCREASPPTRDRPEARPARAPRLRRPSDRPRSSVGDDRRRARRADPSRPSAPAADHRISSPYRPPRHLRARTCAPPSIARAIDPSSRRTPNVWTAMPSRFTAAADDSCPELPAAAVLHCGWTAAHRAARRRDPRLRSPAPLVRLPCCLP